MPKDGYVCAPMLGPGMARPVMPRHHRGSIHWRRGGRRRGRVRLSTRCHPLTVMFSRTPSAGAGKVLAAPDPQGLWPGRHQSLRVQGGRRAGARSRQSRRMRNHECAHDTLSDIDRCSDAEILARLNDSLHAARAETEGRQHVVVEIPRGYPQLDYSAPAGQWVPRGAVLRCLIDENPEGEPVIYIDDHALSLQEFAFP